MENLSGWVKMLHAEADYKEGEANPLAVLLDTPDTWSLQEVEKMLSSLEEAADANRV